MSEPEKPRAEPEILPPVRDTRYGGRDDSSAWAGSGAYRIHVARISPMRIALFAILGALVVAAALFLFAGFLLIAIPVVAALVGFSFVTAWFRRKFRR
jgi:hypothetical protein